MTYEFFSVFSRLEKVMSVHSITKSFVAAPERKVDLNRSRMSDLNEKIRGCLNFEPGTLGFWYEKRQTNLLPSTYAT